MMLSGECSIDRALSGATTPCQSGPGSNGNEGVFPFPKAPVLLEPRICLVSYPGHSLGGYSSAEVQSVYSTAPIKWAMSLRGKCGLPNG